MSKLDGESDTDLLRQYDELFCDRFTDIDAEYTKTQKQASPPPPCVKNWYTRPKRTFNWARWFCSLWRSGWPLTCGCGCYSRW